MASENSPTWKEFLTHVKNGSKIDAVRVLSAVSSLGLKDSYDAVEAFMTTGDSSYTRRYFHDRSSEPGCQLAFENGAVVVMPSTGEVKIDGVFTPDEWQKLTKILRTVGDRWG